MPVNQEFYASRNCHQKENIWNYINAFNKGIQKLKNTCTIRNAKEFFIVLEGKKTLAKNQVLW